MLEARNLSKEYPAARGSVPVLDGVNLEVSSGDAVSILGPSGTGKSTLLYILGALEPPTSGTVTLDGRNPYELSDKELSAFRNKEIGFIFQDHCLLPQCSVLENVLVPTLVAESKDGAEARARSLLDRVGLAHRLEHRPAELSGGEKQRVAIARALVRKPKLVLCDEPTGNLDRATAQKVAELLLEVNRGEKTMLVVVTHSLELAAHFPASFELTPSGLRARN